MNALATGRKAFRNEGCFQTSLAVSMYTSGPQVLRIVLTNTRSVTADVQRSLCPLLVTSKEFAAIVEAECQGTVVTAVSARNARWIRRYQKLMRGIAIPDALTLQMMLPIRLPSVQFITVPAEPGLLEVLQALNPAEVRTVDIAPGSRVLGLAEAQALVSLAPGLHILMVNCEAGTFGSLAAQHSIRVLTLEGMWTNLWRWQLPPQLELLRFTSLEADSLMRLQLSHLTGLHSLSVEVADGSLLTLQNVSLPPSLCKLVCMGTIAGGSSISQLGSLKQLQHLEVPYLNSWAQHLGQLTGLTYLSLSIQDVQPSLLGFVLRLPQLHRALLHLAQLQHLTLSLVPDLEVVSCSHCVQHCLVSLAKLPKLTSLALDCMSLHQEAMAMSLAAVTGLTRLQLRRTGVSEFVVGMLLMQLGSLRQLQLQDEPNLTAALVPMLGMRAGVEVLVERCGPLPSAARGVVEQALSHRVVWQ